jgi:peptide/nickel transport system substrate-binding protein
VAQPESAPDGLVRRQFLARAAAFGLSGSALALLEACGASAGGGSLSPSIGVGLSDPFSPFDPSKPLTGGAATVMRNVFESPLRLDAASHKYVPLAAQALPEHMGGDRYRVRLRKGLSFHDGAPVKPSDVAFSIDYYKNPKVASFLGQFVALDKVTTNGQDVIVTGPSAERVNYALSVVSILSEAYVTRKGNEKWALAPVGSGPFKYVRQVGNTVQLAKHKGYAGTAKTNLDKLKMNHVLDDSTRQLELTSGQLAVIEAVPYSAVSALSKNARVDTGKQLGNRYAIIEMNQFVGPLADERVRQAFMYALDREALVKAVFPGGTARVADSQTYYSDPNYTQPLTLYRPDVAKAKQLLAAAGHSGGVDIDFMVSTYTWAQRLGPIMQQQLAKVGIRAKLRLVDPAQGYTIVASKKYDAFLAYGYSLFPSPQYIYMFSNYGPNREAFFGKGGPNAERDRRYDELCDRALTATTPAEAKSRWAAVEEVYAKTIPNNFAFLWIANLQAWNERLQGYAVSENAYLGNSRI